MTDLHCEKKMLDSMFDHMRDKYKKIGKEDMFDNLAAYYAVNPMKDDEQMTLRDYFAGQVIGMFTGDSTWDERAAAAYALADAMMKARENHE